MERPGSCREKGNVMLIVALLLSIIIGIGIPAALLQRNGKTVSLRRLIPAILLWAALCLGAAAFFRHSVFGGTGLLFAVGASAWLAGLQLLWTIPKKPLPRPILLLAAAIGCEVFLFNLPFYATHSYVPVDLTQYLEEDSDVLWLSGDATKLRFVGLDQPIYNIQLDGLAYQWEGKYPDQQNPLMEIIVSGTDESSTMDRTLGVWPVALKSPRSHQHTMDLTGNAGNLTLEFRPYNGEYSRYPLSYTLEGIRANVPRSFDFSGIRTLVVYISLLAGWLLRPEGTAWREAYLAHRKKYRPAVFFCVIALGVLATLAPFASPKDSGVCTSFYNANDWDGGSRISFRWHINDWQNDAQAQYGALAHSFLQGRLDLEKDPPAELQAMENPLDTAARMEQAPGALWDVAYYRGRYYVYFGVVPALLFQLPLELLTGVADWPPLAGMIPMAWLLILAVFGAMKQAVIRWLPDTSAAAYLLASAGTVAGSQLYYLLLRPYIYEYAILCGVSFVMLALWQWLAAANTPVSRPGAIILHLALGSLCMALVAGCRPQMELFAFLSVPIFWQRYIREKRLFSRQGAREAAAFLLPVLLVAAGLMWYNAARFGSPLDFGANYNLTSNDMTKRGFDPGRIGPALFTTFLSLPIVKAVFPYLDGFRMQTNYMGLTITETYYGGVFACLPLLWGLTQAWPLRGSLKEKRDLCGILVYGGGASVLLAVLDCQMAGVLYRYQSDFSAVLLLTAALCWLLAEDFLSSCGGVMQRYWRAAFVAAAGAGAVYNFFLFFSAEPWLYGQNPALYQTVSRLIQFWL